MNRWMSLAVIVSLTSAACDAVRSSSPSPERSSTPPPPSGAQVDAPHVSTVPLASGLKLRVVGMHAHAVVQVRLVVATERQLGVELVGNAREAVAALEATGADFEVWADERSATIAAGGLTSDLEAMLAATATIASRLRETPTQDEDDDALLERVALIAVRSAEERGPAAQAGDAVLVIAGDVDEGRAVRAAGAAFSGWHKGPALRTRARPPVSVERARVVVVDRPGASTAKFALTFAGAPSAWAGPAATLASAVLGGRRGRIATRLSGEAGLVYLVDHALAPMTARRPVQLVTTSAPLSDAGTVAAALLDEADRMRTAPPLEDEVRVARGSLLAVMAAQVETSADVADDAARSLLFGREPLEIAGPGLAAVTTAEAAFFAAHTFGLDRARLVVLGDARELAPALAALGPVAILRSL